jgi:hypothetical protein
MLKWELSFSIAKPLSPSSRYVAMETQGEFRLTFVCYYTFSWL